ncbi:hypothetical protein GRX03_02835 [Halovenus sp. WSH3]|uniref:Uncharacterized protein n=1 Tax=Halovenus carboxidivorans TaxID=2692199 RepID=A0A6B0SYA8_9EURY|nr:hypothetical protein [Halovenus carboxidivorans]MXR50544.1 hypothetical protein [Halovenus carboxidivorans]
MSGMPPVVTRILTVVFPLLSVFAFAAMIGMAWVVFRDAQERGVSEAVATVWGSGVALLTPLVAPLYLVLVVRSHTRATAVTNRERWLLWFSFSFAFSFAFTVTITPPDPFTQALALLVVLPLVAVGTYVGLVQTGSRTSSEKLT